MPYFTDWQNRNPKELCDLPKVIKEPESNQEVWSTGPLTRQQEQEVWAVMQTLNARKINGELYPCRGEEIKFSCETPSMSAGHSIHSLTVLFSTLAVWKVLFWVWEGPEAWWGWSCASDSRPCSVLLWLWPCSSFSLLNWKTKPIALTP